MIRNSHGFFNVLTNTDYLQNKSKWKRIQRKLKIT